MMTKKSKYIPKESSGQYHIKNTLNSIKNITIEENIINNPDKVLRSLSISSPAIMLCSILAVFSTGATSTERTSWIKPNPV